VSPEPPGPAVPERDDAAPERGGTEGVPDDGATGDGGRLPGADLSSGTRLVWAVRDAARARRPGRRGGVPSPRTDPGSAWSGPAPDGRDPQPLKAVLASLIRARGWQRPAAEATVFARWEGVVGADVAAHCRPVRLVDGELTVEASSTAWATQLRLLSGSLLKRIAAEVGHGVVTRLRVHGPAAPSWQRGPRRVRGRGPRDTYG
jgi:predicted nucleic acid-binding Zn ribbon protein